MPETASQRKGALPTRYSDVAVSRAPGLLPARSLDDYANWSQTARPAKERVGGADIFIGGGADDRKLPFLPPGVLIDKGVMRDYADRYRADTGQPAGTWTNVTANPRQVGFADLVAAIGGKPSELPVNEARRGETVHAGHEDVDAMMRTGPRAILDRSRSLPRLDDRMPTPQWMAGRNAQLARKGR